MCKRLISKFKYTKKLLLQRLHTLPKEFGFYARSFGTPFSLSREPKLMHFYMQNGCLISLTNSDIFYRIADVQLNLKALEKVFLNIAMQAEINDSTAGGNFVTLTLKSRISVGVSATCFSYKYILIALTILIYFMLSL